jgi:hypothetical protein
LGAILLETLRWRLGIFGLPSEQIS